MSLSVLAISFDAHHAARLAQFWAQALRRTVNDGATEDFASIGADTDRFAYDNERHATASRSAPS